METHEYDFKVFDYKKYLREKEEEFEKKRDSSSIYLLFHQEDCMWKKYHELSHFVKKLIIYSDLKYTHDVEETTKLVSILSTAFHLNTAYIYSMIHEFYHKNWFCMLISRKSFDRKYHQYLNYDSDLLDLKSKLHTLFDL